MSGTALGYSRLVRAAQCCAMVALVIGLARPSEAGVQNIPCRRPFVFQGAAVNVVVLPYQSAPGLTAAGDLGEHLAGLLQLEVLRAIAKFGSVGAVQMVGPEADCDPEVVVSKLAGSRPSSDANRTHSRPESAPGGGTVTTCTWSTGTALLHRSRTPA